MNSFKRKLIKFLYAGTGIVGKKNDDVYLVSFPKSGNTWVRFYICNLINQIPEFHFTNEPIDFKVLDDTMVELGVNNLAKKWKFEGFPRIIKTHLPYKPILGRKKTILIVRDPRDVMVSFFKFETTKANNKYRRYKEESFTTFIHHPKFGIESWCKHYLSWRAFTGLLIKYENIKADDIKVFSQVNDYLGISVSQEIFEAAIAKSRFENIQKIEEAEKPAITKKFGASFKFTRSGKTGQWKDYFSSEDIDYLNSTLKKYNIAIY